MKIRKRILVTGSSGFIGSHVVKMLRSDKRNNVVTWDIKDGNDIFDNSFEDEIIKCDVVIHLAALTSVSESFKNPDKTYRVNTLGTARVLDLCYRYKKKLIYPSSAAIYHRDISPYADSKALAEDILKPFLSKMKLTVFRLFNVFGENMNPESGSIMYNFLNNKSIVIYGDGEQTRDFIHVRDVAALIKDAMSSKWDGRIVDVGTGQAYAVNYIAGLFAFHRGKIIIYKPPRREAKWSIANTQALRDVYKKELTTDIKEDIRELIEKL